jgi:metallo-beta-lactamase family protein
LVAGSPALSVETPEPRIDPTQLKRDWHNDYAEFMLRLSSRLQETESPQQRRELIRRLAEALE